VYASGLNSSNFHARDGEDRENNYLFLIFNALCHQVDEADTGLEGSSIDLTYIPLVHSNGGKWILFIVFNHL